MVLLRFLSLLRILDRAQIERLTGFRSISRVNVRLGKLRKAGLVTRFFTGTSTGTRRSIYALTKSGANAAGVPFRSLHWKPDSMLLGNAFVTHQLALSDIYVAAASGTTSLAWKTFSAPLAPSIPLIPDAYVQTQTQAFFVEMDIGTETLSIWSRKATLYLRLATTGAYAGITPHQRFAVLVVARDESRMHVLRRQISKQTHKLFWFATLDIIMRQGFWSPVWLRSHGDLCSPPGG